MDHPSFPSSLPFLHFRFTHKNPEELAKLHTFLLSFKTPFITTVEEADTEVARTHTHTLIQTDQSVIQFAKKFKAKSYFPDSNGKSDFGTCVVKQPTDMLCYVCKGSRDSLPVVAYSSWSSEVIELAHKVFWERNKEIKESHIKKPKKEKQASWTQRVAQEYKEKYPNQVVRHCPLDKYHVFCFCLDRMGAEVKVLDTIIIRRLTLGVVNHLIKEGSQRDNWRKHLFELAFPPEHEQAYGMYNLL